MESAQKKDHGKAPVELVPAVFIEEVAKVLAHGVKKYAADDWTKGLPWRRILGSTLRHIYAWSRREDIDLESGLSHLSHAACNICFLIVWSKTKKELDDRVDYENNLKQ